MNLIPNITSDVVQIQNVTIYDGSVINFQLRWSYSNLSWFFDYFIWNSFTLQGFQITNQPNMFRPWKNILTFGIACVSTNSREPQLQSDFAQGNSNLYVLTASEVEVYEAILSGIPAYSSNVNYSEGNTVYTDNGIFVSLVDNNLGHPVTNPVYWESVNG